jgi:transcriptional regulator with XRE-family HTH domain
MPPKKELDPKRNLHDLAAVVLRRLRLDRSQALQDIADHLGINRSTVARWESGETELKLGPATAIDDFWGVGELLAAIVYQAQTRHDGSWSDERAAMQIKAGQLLIWELAWLPGILQTEEYARASFIGSGVTDLEGSVRKRMKDQQETLKHGPLIRCVLDQGVIQQPVGGGEVMHGQLSHLLDIADEHTIKVVPTEVGAHIGRDGAFWIMTVGGRQAVYSEASGEGRLIRDPGEVASYGRWFDALSDLALSRAESKRLIRQTMEGFQQ